MSSAGENHGFSLVLRVIIFTGGIVVLGILISGATNCRNRWLQPLVIPTPILLAALCQDQLKGHHLRILLLLAGAVALAVAIAAPGRILLTEKLHKQEGLNAPFRALARQLKPHLRDVSLIYCADASVAGNLRIWFPDKIVTAPFLSKLYPPTAHCALVWDPSMRGSAPFVARAAILTGRGPAEAEYFEARLKYHHADTMRLGMLRPVVRER